MLAIDATRGEGVTAVSAPIRLIRPCCHRPFVRGVQGNKADGDECAENEECQSELCNDADPRKCEAKKKNGEDCTEDRQCESGSCNDEKCKTGPSCCCGLLAQALVAEQPSSCVSCACESP